MPGDRISVWEDFRSSRRIGVVRSRTADGQVIGTQTVYTQGHTTWIDSIPVVDDLHVRFTCA
jgi:hypothetical protein